MKKLKKLTMVLLAAALLFTMLAIPASAASEAYGAATVTASALNVRTGPGTSSSRVGLVYRNDRVVILERTSDSWYKINYQGMEGYVSTDYLKDVLRAENFNATGTLIATNVRVRSGPSTSYSQISMVTKGDEVQVIGINNGWYKIKSSSYTGYVRSDFIEITGAPKSSGSSSSDSSSSSNSGSSSNSNSSVGEQIAALARSFVGYPYVYGEESPSRGFDCSGLVYYCYGQFGYSLSRTASKQYANHGTSVSKSELQPGDLVFFSSNGYSVTHVGIYIGDGNFVHASTSTTGVITSSLNSSYYTRVWFGAKRIV